jgi:hypothetical protein
MRVVEVADAPAPPQPRLPPARILRVPRHNGGGILGNVATAPPVRRRNLAGVDEYLQVYPNPEVAAIDEDGAAFVTQDVIVRRHSDRWVGRRRHLRLPAQRQQRLLRLLYRAQRLERSRHDVRE